MALSVRPQFRQWDRVGHALSTVEAQFGFSQAIDENMISGFLSSYGAGTVARELMTPQPNVVPDPNAPLLAIPNPIEALGKAAGAWGALARGDKPEPTMTEEEFRASPDWREAIPYEPGMTKSRLAAVSAMYDVNQARAMMSQKEWGGALIGQFLGQAFDPINYIPFVGEAAQTAAVVRLGSVLGRVSTAALDAAINTAVFGIATAEMRRRFGDAVTFEAMAQEIAMSAVIGGVFGLGVGVLSIPGDRRSAAAVKAAAARMAILRDVQGRMAILSDSTDRLARGEEMNPMARVEFERQVAKFQAEVSRQEEFDIARAVEARTAPERAQLETLRAEIESTPVDSPRRVELAQQRVEIEERIRRVDVAYRAQRELVARGVSADGAEPTVRDLPPPEEGMVRIYTQADPQGAVGVAATVEPPAGGTGWYADVPAERVAEVTGRPVEPATGDAAAAPNVQPITWQSLPKPELPPTTPFRRLMINRFMEGGRSGEEGLALAKTFEAAYANLSARAGWTPEKMLQEYPLPEVIYGGGATDGQEFNQSAVERLQNRAPVRSPRGATYMGVGPQYTVPNPSADAPALQRNAPLIQASTNAGNADAQSEALDALLEKHPSPLASEEAWVALANDAFSLDRVPMPPFRTIEIMREGPEAVAKEISKLSSGMVRDAEAGLSTANEFGKVYSSGEATPDITAKAFLWSFLSRGVSPYVQESAFLDAIVSDTLTSIMQRATREGWNDGLQAEYDAWAALAIPPGSPGRGTQHNLNAFGRNFLRVMTQRHDDAGGRTGLEIIHDMIADGTPSYLIRREFLKRGDGAGIDNKVVSFTMLLLGRSDVLVLDRVQVRNQWNDGRFDGQNIYDSEIDADGRQISGSAFAEMTFGHKGLLYYETMERALEPSIKQAYASLGREGSLGRYHWDSWLLASNQEVGHASVEGLLRDAQKKSAPYVGAFVRQGKYTNYDYGFRYGVLPGGNIGTVVQRLSGDGAVVLPYDVVSDSKGALRKVVSKLQAKAKGRGAEYGTTVPWTAGLTKEERIQYDAALESAGSPAPNLWADDAHAVGRENATGTPDQAGDGAPAEVFDQGPVVDRAARRYVGGLSIQQSAGTQGRDFVPGDADMAALQSRIEARIGAGGEVRAAKALSTEGRYGDIERSVDLEVRADANYDPTPLWKHMVSEAALAKQDSVFLAREIEALDEIDPARHTPGVELLFNGPVARADLDARLEELKQQGVEFLTVMVDGKPSTPGAMPDAIGIRMLYMPEFERRYGFADEDLAGMSEDELGAYVMRRADAMDDQVREVVAKMPGMTGRVAWFDTNTAFGADYGRIIGDGADVQPTGGSEAAAGAAGGEVWAGRPVRERLAAADRHLAYAAQREAGDGGGDAGRASDQLIFEQPAYHGSPHIFDRFEWSDKTRGAGEGAQAFGDGLYFASKKEVAEHYRTALTQDRDFEIEDRDGNVYTDIPDLAGQMRFEHQRASGVEIDPQSWERVFAYFARLGGLPPREPTSGLSGGERLEALSHNAAIAFIREAGFKAKPAGRLYKVDIPGDDELMVWDAPYRDQPDVVKAAMSKLTDGAIERSQGVTGAEFYADLSNRLGQKPPAGSLMAKVDPGKTIPDDAAASRALREAGIPGHRYLDQGSRGAGEGTYNYVIYDDSRVNILDYEQEVRDDASTWQRDDAASTETPRGQIRFKDGRSLVTLFDGADPSTALHEAGHHFLMMIKDMAERTDTAPGIKEDWGAVKGWLAVNAKDVASEAGNGVTADDVLAVLSRNTSGDRMKDIAINRGIHEQWARGFEAYFLEGKAPSAGMRGVFESFKKWLAAIYASVKSLNVNLTPEIRQVFDRLLTDEATPERAVVTAATGRARAPTLDPPPPAPVDPALPRAAAAVGKSEDVAGFEEQVGARVDGTYNEEGDIEMLRSLGRILPEEEAALKAADDGYKDSVAFEKAIKVALACVMP